MSDDARIERVLSLVLQLASGDLNARLDPLGLDDPLDGVTEGLNMLAEELSASTAALRRSEESFRTLIERSPEAIVVHRDNRFIYVNESTLTLLGFHHKNELIGKPVEPLFNFNRTPDITQCIRLIHSHTPPPTTREGQMLHRSGSTLNVEVASIQVTFDGNPATLTTIREISARKRLTAKMMELDRMIAVGTLAAGVGHEINNPLAYIITNLDFAIDRLKSLSYRDHDSYDPSDDLNELVRALAETREGAERVRQIVSDLKTFSRTHSRTEERLELEPVLDSAINMAFNEIRHRAHLQRNFSGTQLVVGNPSRLSQVFLNLIVNAAHAIPEGAARDNHIAINTSVTDEDVVVEVTDSGSGIDPNNIPRLFDPFFTTKPIGQGTGLGLFICHRIVQDHGGEIQVESEPGKGSTFRVLLPRQLESTTHVTSSPSASSTRGSKTARILVVDDEPNIGRSLVRLLGRDYNVSSVTDAQQALTQFLSGIYYDVVLCDLMMPEMTGIDLYREALRLTPKMAANMVFFTGGAFTPASQSFVEQMQGRCLEKPLDMKRVKQIIRERVKVKHKRDESPLRIGI